MMSISTWFKSCTFSILAPSWLMFYWLILFSIALTFTMELLDTLIRPVYHATGSHTMTLHSGKTTQLHFCFQTHRANHGCCGMVAQRGHRPYPSHCRIVAPDVALDVALDVDPLTPRTLTPKKFFSLNCNSFGYHLYVVYQKHGSRPSTFQWVNQNHVLQRIV